ncbi:MAG: molybdenum cofactor guanylyltransferase [bacterium]|nr:molybdenum cofactor guanylyltransferase [Candidatus Kapabacteria bacterium]
MTVGSPMGIAVLAGGASTRMGRDKASIKIDGSSLLEHIVNEALSIGMNVFAIGHDVVGELAHRVTVIWDALPGEGPLAAVANALRSTESELIVVACDMPLITSACLAWLAQLDAPEGCDGIVVRNRNRIEPLFARYRLSCVGAAERLLENGERSLGALIDRANIIVADAPAWVCDCLTNVNTPEELEQLMQSTRGAREASP